MIRALIITMFLVGTVHAQSEQGVTGATTTFPGSVNLNARDGDIWGLKKEEWKKYQELMKGEAGLFYPNATPQYVLAVYETDNVKKREYAKQSLLLSEKAHKQTIELFALQTQIAAEDMGSKRRTFGEEGASAAPSKNTKWWQEITNKRTAVFVTEDCSECDSLARKLINARQVDFYMVGANGDEAIREWAKKIKIPAENIKSKAITLNHGLALSKKLGVSKFPSSYLFDGTVYEYVGD